MGLFGTSVSSDGSLPQSPNPNWNATKIRSYWRNPGSFITGLQGETLRDLSHMTMGLGALIGTFAKNAEQAGQFAGIVATVLAFLGGVFVPIATGPGPLDTLTRISPHRWLLDGFGANAGTGTTADVLIPTLVVAGIGVLLGAIAFGRRSKLTGVV